MVTVWDDHPAQGVQYIDIEHAKYVDPVDEIHDGLEFYFVHN